MATAITYVFPLG